MQQPTGTTPSTTPFTASSDQRTVDNTQVVQRAIGCFQRGDIPALLEMMTDDIDWSIPVVEHVPFSGPRQGRAAVARFFEDLGRHQRARQFEPRQFVAQGDIVVVLGHYAWDVTTTGRSWDADYAHVFTVRDGRVSRFHEYMDTALAAAAFQPRG
ncbi:MAG: nuclear transport factor 2 family protein [Gemmatirosa sp.]